MVWVPLIQFPSWPAIVLKVVESDIFVRYFGDGIIEKVDKVCYLYGKKPKSHKTEVKNENYQSAIKVRLSAIFYFSFLLLFRTPLNEKIALGDD